MEGQLLVLNMQYDSKGTFSDMRGVIMEMYLLKVTFS